MVKLTGQALEVLEEKMAASPGAVSGTFHIILVVVISHPGKS